MGKILKIFYVPVGLMLTGLMIYMVAKMVGFFFSANALLASLTLIAMAIPVALYWAGIAIYLDRHTGVYKQ